MKPRVVLAPLALAGLLVLAFVKAAYAEPG